MVNNIAVNVLGGGEEMQGMANNMCPYTNLTFNIYHIFNFSMQMIEIQPWFL